MQTNKIQQTVAVMEDGFSVRFNTVEPATGGCRVTHVDAVCLDGSLSSKAIPGFQKPMSVAALLRIAKVIESMDTTADRVCLEHGDYRPAPNSAGEIAPPPAVCPNCRRDGRASRPRTGVEVDR